MAAHAAIAHHHAHAVCTLCRKKGHTNKLAASSRSRKYTGKTIDQKHVAKLTKFPKAVLEKLTKKLATKRKLKKKPSKRRAVIQKKSVDGVRAHYKLPPSRSPVILYRLTTPVANKLKKQDSKLLVESSSQQKLAKKSQSRSKLKATKSKSVVHHHNRKLVITSGHEVGKRPSGMIKRVVYKAKVERLNARMVKKGGDINKPRGKMSAYAFFLQVYREELKQKNPNESVNFAEFSKKCAEKWKNMSDAQKKRFNDMAAADKKRHANEMAHYKPPPGERGGKRKRGKKDPNAPKRALSAFFWFCNDERPAVKAALNNSNSVALVAKELGRRWALCRPEQRVRFESLAAKDKERYEREQKVYKAKFGGKRGAGGGAAKSVAVPAQQQQAAASEEDDDDEDDEDDEE